MSRYEFDPMTHEPFSQEPTDERDYGKGSDWIGKTPIASPPARIVDGRPVKRPYTTAQRGFDGATDAARG